jgi:chromosome segregation ATPase
MPETTEQRVTRLENAIWHLAVMITGGDARQYQENLAPAAREAASHFFQEVDQIQTERRAAGRQG